jgi:cyclohexanone monooxygenase
MKPHGVAADPESGIVDIVVIGAGFSGLYMIYQARKLGFSVQGFEAGEDVGGTWFWNRYPGARCDVESLEYSYSFSPELEEEWDWSLRYAEGPEILAYLNHAADRFDLRRHIQFETRVVSQCWDDEQALWEVRSQDGGRVRARFCVMATGNLSTPRVPDFAGLDRFKGRWYHSARWPAEGVDFSGQRVALIGTGATGIQMAPKIAEQAKHLHVFQRTPNFSVPARNTALDADTLRDHRATYPQRRRQARETSFGVSRVPPPTKAAADMPGEERGEYYEALWRDGGSAYFLSAFTDLLLDEEANRTAAEFVRGKIRAIVKDPATAEMLAPKDHPIGTKRLCVDTDYFETFNRDNVTLVDVRRAPIIEITETGLRTADAHYDADAIAFATGFDAMTGALREIEIRGRGGQLLADRWSHGPTAYLGLMVAGFPNMFIVTGPGSPSVKSNMVCSIEQHVEWIADCLRFLAEEGHDAIEPEAEAEQDWVAHVNGVAARTLYPRADSWYSGSNIPGKPRVFMPYVAGIPAYIRVCADVAADNYRGFKLWNRSRPVQRTSQQRGFVG